MLANTHLPIDQAIFDLERFIVEEENEMMTKERARQMNE